MRHAWKPGQSPNPEGRPKRNPTENQLIAKLKDKILNYGDELIDLEMSLARGVKVVDPIAGAVYTTPPDRQAIEYLLNQGLGRPVQRQELTGSDGGAIEFDAINAASESLDAIVEQLAARLQSAATDDVDAGAESDTSV